MFQSAPAPKDRGNSLQQSSAVGDYPVSIRPGPEGPGKPEPVRHWFHFADCFNPPRPRRDGETAPCPPPCRGGPCFNPPGPRGTGKPPGGPCGPACNTCFNPPRPRRTGETSSWWPSFTASVQFQSAPAPKDRGN